MENINSEIFKAYDIRGVYNQDFDDDDAYKIGRAFASLIKKEVTKNDQSATIQQIKLGVARDMRVSSPAVYEKVIAGILDEGVDVVEFGLVSTPTFYYGVAKHDLQGGIQVSASHNPPQYNGFKMTREKAIPISGDTGIMEIRDMVIANNFLESESKGQIVEKVENLIDEHVKYALEYVDVSSIKPLKTVLDTANAMGGPMFTELFKQLPCELIHINEELDGTFPNHEADPLKDENNKQLQEKVKEVDADLGIVLDGDADRVFFIDNNGQTIEQAIVRGILAKLFLQKNLGATICYDIRPGKITEDMIIENGGKPVVTKVGHSLIKEKAREVGAVFAGESSGHFFVKLPFGIFETPMIVTLMLLQEFSKAGNPVSEYIKPLQKYFHSGEINFTVSDKNAVFETLREKYGDALKYDMDGLTFEWQDWWFNVRASNTEPKMRLNLEARTEEIMNQKRDEVADLIK